MPVLLNAPNNAIPRMSRLGIYPLGALRLSQHAIDLSCVGVLTFRGGRPVLIGSGSPLTPANGPVTKITEEGLAYDLTAASSQTSIGNPIAPRISDSNNLTIIARLKPRALPATASAAVTFANNGNHRGIGVGFDSNGHIIGYYIGSISTQFLAGSNVYTSFVTIGVQSSGFSGIATVYENGVNIGNTPNAGSAGTAFTAELRLGQDFGASLNFFDGQIAWAAIFNQRIGDVAQALVANHPEKLLALKYPRLTGSVIAGTGTNFTPPQAAWNWNGIATSAKLQVTPPLKQWNWTPNFASLQSKITPLQNQWNWNGFATTVNSKTQITPPQQSWSWTGFAASLNSKTMFIPPTVVWRWVGNAISGFGSKIAPLLKLMGMGT